MGTETELIELLRKRFPVYPPVRVGIGDDGAVLDNTGRQQIVVTDMLLDGVHFDLRTTSPELVGRKSIAVNLSDLAAMGCQPVAAFVSLALPGSLGNAVTEFLAKLYSGIEQMTQKFHFSLAGGDTNIWDGPFAINVCLIGVPFLNRPVFRSGACPGDVLLVTGLLGGSLHSGRHLSFNPRLKESEWLVENFDVHAMIDLSDGLSLDLHRLADASNVSAQISASLIPVHPDVNPEDFREKRLAAALNDGEDFELLFALSPEDAEHLSNLSDDLPIALTRIGEISAGSGCWLQSFSGEKLPLEKRGWEHQLDSRPR